MLGTPTLFWIALVYSTVCVNALRLVGNPFPTRQLSSLYGRNKLATAIALKPPKNEAPQVKKGRGRKAKPQVDEAMEDVVLIERKQRVKKETKQKDIVVVNELPVIIAELSPVELKRQSLAMSLVNANKDGLERTNVLFTYAKENTQHMEALMEKKQARWNEGLAKMRAAQYEAEQALVFDKLSNRGKKDYLAKAEDDEEGDEEFAADDDDDEGGVDLFDWSDSDSDSDSSYDSGGINPLD